MTNWTVGKVKEELPHVKVSYNGAIHKGVVLGRKLPFAHVTIRQGNSHSSAEFAWETVVHCLNEDKALIF